MKVLFVVDAHESANSLDWIERMGKEYAAIIVGGDLARAGSMGFASEFLTKALSSSSRVYYVPGNADDPGEMLPADVVKLHGQRTTIGGYSAGGLGGSNPTPFHTPFELEDDQARAILSRLGHVDILVSHCPPFNTKCDRAGARQIGSLPVREYVMKHHPRLVLSGHAHDSRAKDSLGGAILVNPGPLMGGNFAEIDLDSEITVELKSGGD